MRSLKKYIIIKCIKQVGYYLAIFLLLANSANAGIKRSFYFDTTVTSTQQQAIAFIDKINSLESSAYWPNIKPALFLQNVRSNIRHPASLYPGTGTNFCGYTALTYLLLNDDPLGYAKILLQLYKEGEGKFGKTKLEPSRAIKNAAGSLRFQGIMDIHPADQMWFLVLADHFKGYLNILNKKYDAGDEDKFWASVNYAKFNRMVTNLLNFNVNARGADILHPHVGDLYTYISKKLTTGKVVLFINNRMVRKKNQVKIKLGFPTHYIVVEKINKYNDVITLTYWDYGGRTQIQITPAFLKKITFGISQLIKKEKNAD